VGNTIPPKPQNMKHQKFSTSSGQIEITSDSIVALREFAEDIKNSVGDGNELPNYISDMIFSIETMYQQYFDLSEDDWEIHEELHERDEIS